MNIVILGGTAFIGPALIGQLNEAGHKICLFNRGQTVTELPDGITRLYGSLETIESFREEFTQQAADVVVHMVPWSDNDMSAVMKTFRGIAGRIVAISSQDVYRAYGILTGIESGEPEPTPLTEQSQLRTVLYPYRHSGNPLYNDYDKILAEKVALSMDDLPGTVLRLPIVYGPLDRQHRLFPIIKRMRDERPLIVLTQQQAQQTFARGYVENIAAAIRLVIEEERSRGKIYNVADEYNFTVQRWIEHLSRMMSWPGSLHVISEGDSTDNQQEAIQDMAVDSSLIRRELGFVEPVTLDGGLRKTIAWELTHKPEPGFTDELMPYKQENEIAERLKLL